MDTWNVKHYVNCHTTTEMDGRGRPDIRRRLGKILLKSMWPIFLSLLRWCSGLEQMQKMKSRKPSLANTLSRKKWPLKWWECAFYKFLLILSEEAVIKWFVSLRFTAEIMCFDREELQWQTVSAPLCARRRQLPRHLVGVKFKLARIQKWLCISAVVIFNVSDVASKYFPLLHFTVGCFI